MSNAAAKIFFMRKILARFDSRLTDEPAPRYLRRNDEEGRPEPRWFHVLEGHFRIAGPSMRQTGPAHTGITMTYPETSPKPSHRRYFFEKFGLTERLLERCLGEALSAGGDYAGLHF